MRISVDQRRRGQIAELIAFFFPLESVYSHIENIAMANVKRTFTMAFIIRYLISVKVHFIKAQEVSKFAQTLYI